MAKCDRGASAASFAVGKRWRSGQPKNDRLRPFAVGEEGGVGVRGSVGDKRRPRQTAAQLSARFLRKAGGNIPLSFNHDDLSLPSFTPPSLDQPDTIPTRQPASFRPPTPHVRRSPRLPSPSSLQYCSRYSRQRVEFSQLRRSHPVTRQVPLASVDSPSPDKHLGRTPHFAPSLHGSGSVAAGTVLLDKMGRGKLLGFFGTCSCEGWGRGGRLQESARSRGSLRLLHQQHGSSPGTRALYSRTGMTVASWSQSPRLNASTRDVNNQRSLPVNMLSA